VISEGNHVTTEVMMLTIQLNITGRNYILKYIKIENSCLGEHKTYFKTF